MALSMPTCLRPSNQFSDFLKLPSFYLTALEIAMFRLVALSLLMLYASPARCEVTHEEGFTPLFDGKTLSGWAGEASKYFTVELGTMACQKGCRGKLLTEREYSDFVLKFEFKLTPGANNGLAIRAPKAGDAAYVGIELQILDDTAEKYSDLKDFQFHGSAYGIAAAKRGALKPVGEWNAQEVHCKAQNIKVTLNNQVILDIELAEAAPNNITIDGKDHPGILRKQGHLGFLCHDDPVHFRNIRIKELPSAAKQ